MIPVPLHTEFADSGIMELVYRLFIWKTDLGNKWFSSSCEVNKPKFKKSQCDVAVRVFEWEQGDTGSNSCLVIAEQRNTWVI